MDPARLASLRDDVKSRKGSFVPGFKDIWRDLALARASLPERSLGQIRAGTVLELVKAAPKAINASWSLAGEHLLPCPGAASFAQHRIKGDEALAAELDSIGMASEIESVKSSFARYHSRCSARAPGTPGPGLRLGAGGWGGAATDMVFMDAGWKENHSIRDYKKLLRVGFGGLKREIEAELESRSIAEPGYAERETFLRGALPVCEAGLELAARYRALAEKLASEAKDAKERERLLSMAGLCAKAPAEGALSLKEAVQCLWLGHIVACAEDGINANSIGRLDQILHPYFQADMENGLISKEEAVELMAELAAKLYLDYDVQAITLGGVDSKGSCAVNETSFIILEATELFGELRDLSVRVGPSTPESFLDECAKLILKGGGIPFLFNDECFVPALAKRGVKLEDARDYAPIGCVELTIPGKANPHAVSGWFNILKCLELALHDGVDPLSGRQLGPRSGALSSFESYEELFEAFRRQIEFFLERMVYNCRRGELAQSEFGPLPCWSLLTDDCVKRGRDVTDGGAVYNYHSICLMGVPDAADALAALKTLLFEREELSSEELLEAMKADFKDSEPLRRKLLAALKYGNGEELPDSIAAELSRLFIGELDRVSAPGSQFFAHLFTFKLNLDFGKKVGGMPDGRHAGEPLAYSLSAHQGRDLNGVTALLRSLARQPHAEAAGGSAAIIDLHPSLLEKGGTGLLTSLIKSAFAMGAGQTQWNVVSAERLLKAKEDPERFGNIPVRVAGYSQLFRLIEPELQDHIIARRKHLGA